MNLQILPPQAARVLRQPAGIAAGLMAVLIWGGSSQAAALRPAGEVFGHQVLPILQRKCLRCHGEGKTKGGLDLTTFAVALKGGISGDTVLPGKSRASLLWKQIAANEMPPEGEERVTYEELQTISRWIDSSAFPDATAIQAQNTTSVHDRAKSLWSFQPVQRPESPLVKDASRVSTAVDRFVLAKLESNQLTFAAEADRRTLIRRVAYNLTGLPPTPGEVDAFVNETRPDSWERLVNRLLASPHYGERWGRHWLDVAGWAESSLLIGDFVRPDFWRYRDWVIRAFNDDMSYDRFVREQLSGDEMVQWRDAEQFDADMIDKLTATGFLRCPPDGTDNQPITQEEKMHATQQTAVEVATKALLGLTLNCVRCHDHKYDPITQQEYYELIAVFQPAYDPGHWIPGMVNTFGAGPVRMIPIRDRKEREAFAKHAEQQARENAEFVYQKEVGIPNKYRDRYIGEHLETLPDGFDRALIQTALSREERQRTQPEKDAIYAAAKHFELGTERLKEIFPDLIRDQRENQSQHKKLKDEAQKVGPVIWALWDVTTKPTPARLLTRGEFTKPAHAVQPGILRALDRGDQPWQPPSPGSHGQTTGFRTAFAKWVTRPDHPLTARVMVNRIWQYHFGTGLVSTPDDFGTRGARPSHPELLDWLASEFVASGWSVKHLHRLILNSTTYRQRSGATAAHGDQSQLASFPRRRIEAEAIRDAMLSVAGKLDAGMFGESIPTKQNADGSYDVPADHPGRNRRSVYLSTRRTQLPTFLSMFDAPSMDTNWPRRSDSAIAPQSLILMNHPFVTQCADDFATRVMAEAATTGERIALAYALAYGREPQPDEQKLLSDVLASADGEAERETWRTLAHALLASNEFLYLD